MSMQERVAGGAVAGLSAIGIGLGALAPVAIVVGALVAPWFIRNRVVARDGRHARPEDRARAPRSAHRKMGASMRNERYFERQGR
jgi:hypothetical protein